ncbi:A disintegrin and metalloproteinase with thrombospondin motifs 7-like isoform X2 [Macaca nemestrina]|uniref:A disintegrin and metalloproteinase with thrombospondin motifs 7-like isoform X2 n=1 Tax=Macaca nemestrina TaxID=9545 RepID=UPI0039B82549
MLVSWVGDLEQSLQPVPVMPTACPSFSTALCRGSPNLTLYWRKLRPRGWLKTCPRSHKQVGGRAQASCCHLPAGPYKQEGCVWATGWAAQGRRTACTKLGGRHLGVWVQEEAARSGLWPCSSIHQSLTRAHPGPPHRPKYKGRYCVGERKRFRLCNLQACPAGRPSFCHIQCSHFDATLYEGQLHTWVPVVNDVNPCELHCRPSNEYFAEKLRDTVVDGTPCYQVRASRDLCINGICKNVGCDFEIDSGAMEDRCGVCHGNGSTCHTVSGTFEEAEGLGYVDVGLIPAGAREIRIQEVAEAANFLALRSEDPEKYFLNGGWTIQWNGDYQVAGTTFTYARRGNWENLTSPGPTNEPVWIQLLFQESNPGVRYEYTIHREAGGHGEVPPPEFSWHYGSWTKCTVTCGRGSSDSPASAS